MDYVSRLNDDRHYFDCWSGPQWWPINFKVMRFYRAEFKKSSQKSIDICKYVCSIRKLFMSLLINFFTENLFIYTLRKYRMLLIDRPFSTHLDIYCVNKKVTEIKRKRYKTVEDGHPVDASLWRGDCQSSKLKFFTNYISLHERAVFYYFPFFKRHFKLLHSEWPRQCYCYFPNNNPFHVLRCCI